LSVIDKQILNLLLQPIKADLHVTDVQMGFVQGPAFTLLYSVLGIPLGRLVDLSNRRRLIVFGVLTWSISTSAFGLAQTYPQMIAARAFVAIGEAVLVPASYSLFADLFEPRSLGRAMSTFVTGAVIGSGGGLIITGALFGVFTAHPTALGAPLAPWRLTFLCMAVPGIVVACLVWRLVIEPERSASTSATPEDPTSLRSVVRWIQSHWQFYASVFCAYIAYGALLTGFLGWVPTYLVRSFGVSPAEVGKWLGLVMLATGLSSPIAFGWIADRLYVRWGHAAGLRLFGYLLLFMGVGGLLAFRATSFESSLINIAALALIVSGPPILGTLSLQLATPSRMRGQITAINALCTNLLGYNAGSLLVPALSERGYFGTGLGPAIAATVCATAAAAALAAFVASRPDGIPHPARLG
jgi:MFS family permease